MRQIWHEDLSPCFSKSCLYEINQLVLQWVWIENILSSACLSMRLLLTTGKQRTMWEWFTSTPTRTCLCLFCNLHFKTRKKELDSIAHTTCHSLLSPFSASASFFFGNCGRQIWGGKSPLNATRLLMVKCLTDQRKGKTWRRGSDMELFDGSVEDSVCVWHVYICLYMCIYVALCVCVCLHQCGWMWPYCIYVTLHG